MMVGLSVVGLELGLDLEFGTFLFWVVLGVEGLGYEGGCFLGFLAWSEGLGLHGDRGKSFLLVGSLGLGWMSLAIMEEEVVTIVEILVDRQVF